MKLGTSAVVAGIALLMLVFIAPYAELYAYPKLVSLNNAQQTTINIQSGEPLFVSMLLAYLLTCILDIIAAWALYSYLSPVNKSLSLLAALFRIVYAVVFSTALFNLVTVYNLTAYADNKMFSQVLLSVNEFRNNFHFAIIFFAVHLLLVGYIIIRANYIPAIMGILVIISGLGYLASALKPFLFKNSNLGFAVYTFYGELVFMLWLLVKGSRTKETS